MNPSNAAEALDLSIMRSYTEGDTEMEKKLVGLFIKQADEAIKILGANSKVRGSIQWRETAHALKGNAATIGANLLSKLCADAQHFMGPENDQAALFEKIEAEYGHVKEQLKTLNLLA